jgi:hypothetical protein
MVLILFNFFAANAQKSKDIKLKSNENKFQVISKSSQGLTVYNSLSGIKISDIVTKGGNFVTLENENLMKIFDAGNPNIPVISRLIEVPIDATVEFRIVSYNEEIINLNEYGITNKIIPAQPSMSKSDDPAKVKFHYNKTAYQVNSYNNSTVAVYEESGIMRAVRFGRIEIRPVQYNPVTNTLRILNNLVVEIKFPGANEFKTKLLKEKYYSPYYENILYQTINHESGNADALITAEPVKYVIVADPMFQTQLQPFIVWKKLKGFNVIEAYTNNPLVGNTTTSIKNYLQTLYNNGTPADPAPSFVLFVGDVEQIPVWAGTAGSHVTDLYYCEYTGDKVPEVFYGRFSAQNTTQLQTQIDRTIEYEKYLMPDPSYLGRCVMVSGMDGSYAAIHGNGQINYGTSTYFNSSNGLTSDTYLYPGSGGNAAVIRTKINNGVSYANYTAHGGPTGWSDPAFDISHLATFNNDHKFGLLVGNCCLTNKFEVSECFGEALLRTPGKGAIGYIGGTNSTYWDEDFWWGCGFKAVVLNPTYDAAHLGGYDVTFHTHSEPTTAWYITQGQMVVGGNMANQESTSSMKTYYWEIYTLMGDPSLMIYYGVPAVMTVTPNPSTLMIGMTTLTVNAAPYSYVALSLNGTRIATKLANGSGVAVLTFPALTSVGTADLVVTAQNKRPYIGTISITPSNQPYVVLNSYTTTAPPNFGQSIGFNVTLQNVSNAPYNASNVNATLSTSNSYITITDNAESYGTINAGASVLRNNAFGITLANNIPDQTSVDFNIQVTGSYGTNNYTWNSPLLLIANAPVMSIGNITVLDPLPLGNNNGRLDPGETATVSIQSSNTGHANATGVVGSLTESSPWISITNGTFNIGNLNYGATVNATYTVVVDNATPIGTPVTLNYTLTGGQYTATKPFVLTIGMIYEDWETNTFTKFPWQNPSPSWTLVSGGQQYEGSYCAKSATITHNQSTNISINYQVDATSDTIKFYKKVNSEAGYDYLEFYIDATRMERWSGTTDVWSFVKYPVTQGAHIFKWQYIKDGSISTGSDCGWVDYIIFPSGRGVGINSHESGLSETALNCYPNPANNTTTVSYTLNKSSVVLLTVYNSFGEVVKVMVNNSKQTEGLHNEVLNVDELSAGIYYCVLKTDNNVITKKITVTK